MSTSRHCYVVGCSNGDYKLLRWSNNKCETHGCFLGTDICTCNPPFRLFAFPPAKREPEKRLQWLRLMKRADPKNTARLLEPSKDHRVCSGHFVDGAPTNENPHPSMNLGYKREPDYNTTETPRSKRQKQRADTPKQEAANAPPTLEEEVPVKDANPQLTTFCVLSLIISMLLSLWRKVSLQLNNVKAENCKLRKEVSRLQKEVRRLQGLAKETIRTRILKSDLDVHFYTGLKDREYFMALHDKVVNFVRRRWTGIKNSVRKGRKFVCSPKRFGPKTKLSSLDELLLTLMKLRLGLLNQDLASRFKISVSLCNQIFNSWLTALYKTFGKTVKWYPKDNINATLPQRFRCLPNLRTIIDCTEIFIETPKDMILQSITWSNYKHHNTAKVLVSIAPNSMITYLSPAYGGRLSDKRIVELSQFLDLLDTGDMVMADKGFLIEEECLVRNLQLYIPPGKRGASQMSIAAVNKTKRIAKLRILVEQVIRRLKTFRILKCQLPISLLPSLDKMLIVCAALSNLMGPIYRN